MRIENFKKISEIIGRIYKYISRILIIPIVILLIVGLFLEKEINLIEDSTIINVPIEQVWERTNSFTKITKWTSDTIMKGELIGSDGKVGAKYIYESDSEGRTTVTITRIEEPNYISYAFNDEEGKELFSVNFKLLSKEEATLVTFEVNQKVNYPYNILYLVKIYTNKKGLEVEKGQLILKLKKLLENQ